MSFFFFNGFTDKYVVVPNLNLVNQPDLDKILKVEVFVHKNGQLRATYLILGYEPLSSSFQAPKCMIRARDPCLHQINIAVLGFLILDPVPEGVQKVAFPFQRTTEEEATLSQPMIKEEEQEELVEVSDSEDNFEVVNLPLVQVRQTQENPTISNAIVL